MAEGYHGGWQGGVYWGRWWMFQWSFDRTFSLGIHIDPIRRGDYGPYMDIHVVCAALSLGRNPGRANNNSLIRPRARSHYGADH